MFIPNLFHPSNSECTSNPENIGVNDLYCGNVLIIRHSKLAYHALSVHIHSKPSSINEFDIIFKKFAVNKCSACEPSFKLPVCCGGSG